MRVAIIDFETTSADKKTARPWEWAVTITDECFKIFDTQYGRMWSEDYEDISPEAMRICKLKESRLFGVPTARHGIERIDKILHTCDFVGAYNAAFDRAIYEAEATRQGVALYEHKWFCALQDVQYEDFYRCRQLSHLCFDHGIPAFSAHDAASDTRAVAELLAHRGETIEKILAYRDDPWVYMKALLPKPWGPGEAAAKELQAVAKKDGYSWQTAKGTDAPVFEKSWVKRVKRMDFEAEKAKKLPFKREELYEIVAAEANT